MRIRTRRVKENIMLDLIISLQFSFEHAPKFAGSFKEMVLFLAKSELQIFPCAKLYQIGQKWDNSTTTDIDRYPEPHDDAILTL